MSPASVLIALAAYLALLFWIARRGDRKRFSKSGWPRNPLIYSLSLGVYCTSWTFYGLVGTAASSGWDFIPILLGPILLFSLGFPLLHGIAKICRRENIHSLADFIASRYGKRQSIAFVVTLIVLTATVPYIALQLKAVSDSLELLLNASVISSADLTLIVTITIAAFTLIFGASRLEVSTYHSGLMSAIAFESLLKLIAILAVALFALAKIQGLELNSPINQSNRVFSEFKLDSAFWVMTFISAASILCLPRMFQVTFVECLGDKHLNQARWLFPLYLSLFAVAIVLIAWAGNQWLNSRAISGDSFVLALPLQADKPLLALLVFLGGFSAATAMIIVATLALSFMLSNDVILPIWVKGRSRLAQDFTGKLVAIRRISAIVVIALAWLYQHQLAENVALTEIGLIAFALAAQLAPAMFIGLFWSKGNADGVLAGLGAGSVTWFVSLMLPLLCKAGLAPLSLIENGIFGVYWLRPENLLGLEFSDPYTRGVIISLCANCLVYLLISLFRSAELQDRVQAIKFTQGGSSSAAIYAPGRSIKTSDLETLLRQFLGSDASQTVMSSSFNEKEFASAQLLNHAEQALSGVIGVASARSVLHSLSQGGLMQVEEVVSLIEQSNKSLRFNQDLVSTAFDHMASAISVVNSDLQLVAWNQQYQEIFAYPPELLKVGTPIKSLLRHNAKRGLLGESSLDTAINRRLEKLQRSSPYKTTRKINDISIEITGVPLPNGGYLSIYDDISDFMDTQETLERSNLYLENRVKERTHEIAKVNDELRQEIEKRKQTEQQLLTEKRQTESAHSLKSQFLALASHDLLQPLNAANLFASAAIEDGELRQRTKDKLIAIQSAMHSAEQIISNLLEISKLDSGDISTDVRNFPLRETMTSLASEHSVQCQPSVDFQLIESSLWVRSDPKYLRRILQNYLSNAVKYTEQGRIIFGCRRRGNEVEILVYDTGSGIPEAKKNKIFDDYFRAHSTSDGAGLGLGIAQRFSRLLGHTIKFHSPHFSTGGSCFSVIVPRADHCNTPASSPGIKQASSRKLSILYIDDEPQNTEAVNTIVRNWNCSYSSCSNLNHLDHWIAQQEMPNFILIDYQLRQNFDGFDVAKQLLSLWPEVAICIVSASQEKELPKRAEDSGLWFLAKPIKPAKLRALIEFQRSKIK
jgi:Na+/proline symporter/signal transduction histidine kinase